MVLIEKVLTLVSLIVLIRYTWHKGTEIKLNNKLKKLKLIKRKRRGN